MKLIVASKNPVKLAAAARGFQAMFPGETFEIEGVSVPSGVNDQPMSSAETQEGAKNRMEAARTICPDANFWIGIEGGVEDRAEGLEAFAWVLIEGRDGTRGYGKTGSFFLPTPIARLVREGTELGAADDVIFGRTNSKQENGAVGILTDNAIDRTEFYAHAVILALIPLKNPGLYRDAS